MTDTYANWAALAAANVAGTDYRLDVRDTGSRTSHIAIHGGNLEDGTTELAAEVAAVTRGSYYSMVSLKPGTDSTLHLTSTHYDEPQALTLQGAVSYTVSYHGAAGTDLVTQLGGADTVLRDKIGAALTAAGFHVILASTELDGNDPNNITQRNRRGRGVQLEISRGQRAKFFPADDLSQAVRDSGARTATFRRYVAAVASVVQPQEPTDNRLRVYIRNAALARVGQVDDYTSLTVVPRHNAIGSWALEISADSDKADLLVEGNGVIITTASGDTVMSGPIRTPDWSRSVGDGGSGKITVGGVDDTTLLAQYTCWPKPTAAIGSQTDPVYKISAVKAEAAMRALVNVNAGPGALTARKNPLLTLAADGANGAAITREVDQFANLLTTLADIANAAGLGVRVIQVSSGLQFQVYVPVDRSGSARFSFGLGNLSDASYTTTPPTCTRAVVVAGGGTSPRVCKTYDQVDPLFPTLVLEQFVDLTSVDTASVDLTAQMDQAAAEALTAGAGQGALSISPIDIPALRYGRDYKVGDTVAAQLRGGTWYTDVVREVSLTSTATDGTQVKATVSNGDSGTDAVGRLYAYIARLKKDVAKIKTRKVG